MKQFFHALEVFWDQLAAVGWGALAIALGLHVLKNVVRTFAWRNILCAAFPGSRVRRRTVIGAYFAGIGVNSIVPERGFAIVGHRRRYLTEVVSWQALSWAIRIAAVWWFLRAFQIPATLHNALLVLVVQALSTLLPFSPGGAGTQQGLGVYVLRGRA